MRIALAQINPTVGDFAGNLARHREFIARARAAGAALVIFPELALSGYPPEDLLFRPAFLDAAARHLAALAAAADGLTVLTGFPQQRGRSLWNACAILAGRRLCAVYRKQALPNYGVFDEQRYFRPGRNNFLIEQDGWHCGVSICEDIWRSPGPAAAQAAAGARLLINISASPFEGGKQRRRAALLTGRAAEHGVCLCYVNMVGGQDELVFDGQSMVLDPRGRVIAVAPAFEETLLLADLPAGRRRSRARRPLPVHRLPPSVAPAPAADRAPAAGQPAAAALPEEEATWRALVTGTRDYADKNGFRHVLIGLSGGLDSALVTVIACDALGPSRVRVLYLPSRYSAPASARDSRRLAANLGISCETVPIEPLRLAYQEQLAPFLGAREDVTSENLQARIRGAILMAWANRFGCLLLTTGNKSELAVGYCTMYGDMCGGFAVLKDVSKTLAYRLAAWRNRSRPVIPRHTITRAPSAELRPGQKDSDSLPDYAILDPIMAAFVEEDRSAAEIIARGHDPETVCRVITLIEASEFKRRQAPPGVKVTARAFGRDWRQPLSRARGGPAS